MATSALSINSATAKLTVSIKRRLGNGDEVFLAPGIELSCAPDELDAKQAEVTERVHGWVENLLALYPDPTDDAEDADEDDAEDDTEDADEDGDEDEDGLSEEDIDAMDKKGLQALIKEHELEIEGAAKMAVKALREAVKEALFSEDEDEDADDDAEDEDEDGEDEDGDEDSAGYTDEELKAMKLEELQEICKEWDIGTPKLAKGADLKAKKAAYIKHVKAAQEAEE